MHYVIVGNGVAGIEAALALRARDDEARITLVSAEHDHFFSRPALMYVFAGQMRLRDTEPYDRGLYERMRFERVSERVTRGALPYLNSKPNFWLPRTISRSSSTCWCTAQK